MGIVGFCMVLLEGFTWVLYSVLLGFIWLYSVV